jgi:hypothetical protein
VSSLARPGTGGRQPSIARGFEIEATREVRDRLGEPTDHTFRGALLHVWEIPGGEDGIIAARLSGQDVTKHETVFGQIHGLLDICERRALKPRFLIASMRNSGHRTYATRLDFSFIRDRVHAGQCSWVAYLEQPCLTPPPRAYRRPRRRLPPKAFTPGRPPPPTRHPREEHEHGCASCAGARCAPHDPIRPNDEDTPS